MIDYRKVLETIDHATDPVAALEAWTAQEREMAAYEVAKRVDAAIAALLDGFPTYGARPDEQMPDVTMDGLIFDLRDISDAAYGIVRPQSSRGPRNGTA